MTGFFKVACYWRETDCLFLMTTLNYAPSCLMKCMHRCQLHIQEGQRHNSSSKHDTTCQPGDEMLKDTYETKSKTYCIDAKVFLMKYIFARGFYPIQTRLPFENPAFPSSHLVQWFCLDSQYCRVIIISMGIPVLLDMSFYILSYNTSCNELVVMRFPQSWYSVWSKNSLSFPQPTWDNADIPEFTDDSMPYICCALLTTAYE